MNPFVAECLSISNVYKNEITSEGSPWFDMSNFTEAEASREIEEFNKLVSEDQIHSYEAIIKYLPFPEVNIATKSAEGKRLIFRVKTWPNDKHPFVDIAFVCEEFLLEAEVHSYGVSTHVCGTNSDGSSIHIDNVEEIERGRHILAYGVFTVSCLIGLCIKSKAVAYKPVANPKNAARAAKGKKPLFDWTTVEIKSVSYKNTPLGGTHASPRQHDRRGHFRMYKSGKRVWVAQTKVGKASNGVIFHDYKIAPLTT